MYSLSQKIDKLSNFGIYIVTFFYTLFVRFPFFFRDYVDRDESTFILMGQSWVDGHLPFTELWDVKPPLLFFFFGVLIYLFGKSFIAIRLAGVLLVAISSFFTYKIAKQLYSKNIALAVALLSVILQSLFGSIQGVMSEHIVMACFMPALWLLTRYPNHKGYFLLVGILLGAALMIKLNMAYAVLLIGAFIIIQEIRKKAFAQIVWKGLLLSLGGILVFALCFLPYYNAGLDALWWNSVIEAPLQYASARTYNPLKMAPYLVPIILYLFLGWKKKFLDLKNPSTLLLVLVVLGVLWSFVKSGRANSHYLILLHPVLVILVGFYLHHSLAILKKVKPMICLLLLFAIPVESYLEYGNIIQNKIERDTWYNGEGIVVPQYLTQNNLDMESVLFFEYHIGYWTLNKKPPTKAATQPSNILKDEMFFAYDNPRKTGKEELRYLMEEFKPEVVVTRKNRKVFDKKEYFANAYINAYLENRYQKLDSVDGAMIYIRLK